MSSVATDLTSVVTALTKEELTERMISLILQQDPKIRKILNEFIKGIIKSNQIDVNWEIKFFVGNLEELVKFDMPTIEMGSWDVVGSLPPKGELLIASVSVRYRRNEPYSISVESPFAEYCSRIPIDDHDKLASAIGRINILPYIRRRTG